MTLDNAIHPDPTETTSPRWHRAAHAVLSTNELLCNIIARLPLKDIVAATGICKAWRNAMAADPSVQQALFLKPVEISEVLVEDRILLALDKSEAINIDRTTVVGQLNPLAKKLCGSIKFRSAQSRGLPLPHNRWRGCSTEPWSTFGHKHPGGTWRDMFITQPPCVRVHVNIYEMVKAAPDRRSEYVFTDDECVRDVNGGFNLERAGGVKLGQFYDYIIHEYLGRGEGKPSVRTTVRKYVSEPIEGSDRTRCVVRKGEVFRPEQLPNQPVADCDAFGNPGRAFSQVLTGPLFPIQFKSPHLLHCEQTQQLDLRHSILHAITNYSRTPGNHY